MGKTVSVLRMRVKLRNAHAQRDPEILGPQIGDCVTGS